MAKEMNTVSARTEAASSADQSGRMSGEERRRQIIQVAMRLFSQKGFTGTTTKEIALAAGVNEALIFRHFATKDDLYAAILEDKACEVCAEDWLADLREIAARRDDAGVFRYVAQKRLEHLRHDESFTFLRLMFYSSLEGHGLAHRFLEQQARPIHKFLCDYVKLRQREGAFRRIHPGIAVSAFIGMLNHHIITYAFFEKWRINIADKEAISNYVDLLLGGLCAAREPAAKISRKSKNGNKD